MDLKVLGLALCAVAAIAIVGRILWLFANRTPVLAHSENMDSLGESDAHDPLNPLDHAQGFHSGDMRVEYALGGQRYEHDVLTHSVEGLDMTAPDDMPILWADPKNPADVEAHGPGFWVLMLLLVGAVAASIAQFS